MFECSKQGSVHVISSDEPLNREQVVAAGKAFESCYGKGLPKIVFDLQSIPLIDSAGLELLLDMRDRCLQRGGALQLAAPNALCRDILQVTDLAREFAIFDNVTAAVGSYSQ